MAQQRGEGNSNEEETAGNQSMIKMRTDEKETGTRKKMK